MNKLGGLHRRPEDVGVQAAIVTLAPEALLSLAPHRPFDRELAAQSLPFQGSTTLRKFWRLNDGLSETTPLCLRV